MLTAAVRDDYFIQTCAEELTTSELRLVPRMELNRFSEVLEAILQRRHAWEGTAKCWSVAPQHYIWLTSVNRTPQRWQPISCLPMCTL